MPHIQVKAALKKINAAGSKFRFTSGNLEIVGILNDYGAEVDARDASGQTPLHIACAFGHLNVVR